MSLIRKLLFYPFAALLYFITSIRNFFFDVGIFKEYTFDYFSIGIGNISVGGTGKSVLVGYLSEILCDRYVINILSRGYRRKSSGFQLANKTSTASHLGDEPYMFYKQNHKITFSLEINSFIPSFDFEEDSYRKFCRTFYANAICGDYGSSLWPVS